VAFTGWPAEAIEFFDGLEVDNSKTYWTAHKHEYEQCVQAPMADLLAELAPEFGDGRIFRPYRDVRFSRDKSPYKTNIAASLASGGYLSLSASSFGVGSGIYRMAPDQIERYRTAVADDRLGSELQQIIGPLERQSISVSSHDVLKTAPKGYPKDHPRIDLLRYKDLVCWKEWPIGPWLGTAKAKKNVVEFLRATGPINAWLAAHVGEARDPHGRR